MTVKNPTGTANSRRRQRPHSPLFRLLRFPEPSRFPNRGKLRRARSRESSQQRRDRREARGRPLSARGARDLDPGLRTQGHRRPNGNSDAGRTTHLDSADHTAPNSFAGPRAADHPAPNRDRADPFAVTSSAVAFAGAANRSASNPDRADLFAVTGSAVAFAEPFTLADPSFAQRSGAGAPRWRTPADSDAAGSSESHCERDPDTAAGSSESHSERDPDTATDSPAERRPDFVPHPTPGADRNEHSHAKTSRHRDANVDRPPRAPGGRGTTGLSHADPSDPSPVANELPHTSHAACQPDVSCRAFPHAVAASRLLGFPSGDGRAPNRR